MPVDQRSDPHGQHPGLARAGAGQHQQRPVHVLDRLPLGRIERVLQTRSRRIDHAVRAGQRNAHQETGSRSVGSRIIAPPWASSTTRRESASPMPQPPRLVVMPGSNRVRRMLLGHPRSVVDHPDRTHPVHRADPQDNRAGPSLQRIDRVLHQ